MLFSKFFLLLCLLFNPIVSLQWYSNDPDIQRTSVDIIQSRGFLSETHSVTTEDGYILTIFRVMNPFLKDSSQRVRPIYIQHGMFGSSDHFLINAPGLLGSDGIYREESGRATNCSASDTEFVGSTISFVLSACGYDVWLGNNRGTRYSTRHTFLNSETDNKYWAYNIDHMTAFDIPATIQYIRNVTKSESIGYIGHSLGTSMMFQLLSTKPFQYTPLIRPFIALAPVAFVGNIESLLLRIGALFEPIYASISAPFFGMSSPRLETFDRFVGRYVCGNTLLNYFCELLVFLVCGFDSENTNTTRLPQTVAHFPDGASFHMMAHLSQRVNRNDFNYFDYGYKRNKLLYGDNSPPKYDLSLITSRDMVFISGINDYLADPTDVDLIRSRLKVPLFEDYVIPYELFNHADFLIGINAGKYVNAKVLQILQHFN